MALATKAYASVGATAFVATGMPTTYDAAGWGAVASWNEIGELDSIGDYGPKSDLVTRTPLKLNVTDKLKGARNYGSCALAMAYAPADVGQAAIIAAEKLLTPVSIKVVDSNGTIDYFTALVMEYTKSIGAAGDFTKATSTLEIKSSITTV